MIPQLIDLRERVAALEAKLLEHLTVAPGEVLIVRLRADAEPVEIERTLELLAAAGLDGRAIVIAGDIQLAVVAKAGPDLNVMPAPGQRTMPLLESDL